MKDGPAKVSPPTSPPDETKIVDCGAEKEVDWGAEEEFLAGLAGGGGQQLSQHEQEVPDDFMSELSSAGESGEPCNGALRHFSTDTGESHLMAR